MFGFDRNIAEETIADLEKEKTMKELELKDIINKHRNDLSTRESILQALREKEKEASLVAERQRKVRYT